MSKRKLFIQLLSLGVCGGSIYIIPYIRYVFYEQQMAIMGVTNAQLGFLSTVYAVTAIILFIPGGIIADRFNAKKLIVLSLLGTTLLTVWYALAPTYTVAKIVWAGLSVTTAMSFWSAFVKFIDSLGDETSSGRIFGSYYALNGICAAIINALALYAGTRFGFEEAMLVVAGGTFVAMIMIIAFIPGEEKQKKDASARAESLDEGKFKLSDIKIAATYPGTWILGIIGVMIWAAYSYVSYFNPYLIDVVGVSPEDSGVISIIRTYILMLMAPVGGLMCDKVFKSSAKWFVTAFIIIGALFAGVTLLPSDISPTFAGIYTLIPSLFGMALYGVQFSIMNELHVPKAIMGTVIGVSSLLSWTDDFIFPPLFGTWLDNHGNAGYNYIFITMALMCFAGAVASYFALRLDKKHKLAAGR